MEKILIIDADESVRERLKRSLEGGGFPVIEAEDRWKGLALCEEFQPEVVVVDGNTAGIANRELLCRLKQLDPDIEVIVVADHRVMDSTIEALRQEPFEFIPKPVSGPWLNMILRRIRERLSLRRKLQEALKEIQDRDAFEYKLIHTSMDGIIANDDKGNIVIFNEGASRICGYTEQEAKNSLHVTQLYPTGEARKIKKHIMAEEYGGPGHLINYETQLFAKDGRTVPILLSASLIHDDGRAVATVGFFKDLTDVKRLQQEVLDKTRMAAIGEAIAEVAHNVKNILYGLKLGAFTVNKGLKRADLGSVGRGWKTVQKNIDRISRFSLDMLRYARQESLPRESIHLNALVREICSALKDEAENHGIELEQILQEDLPTLRCDAAGLHSCLLNLITNALEAFPESAAGGRVVVRTESMPKGEICLEVSDTGKGMPPKLLAEIFKPLFSTKGARGTGLGLAITEKIVLEHQGSIQVSSEPQKGTTFRLFFPVRSEAEPPDSPETDQSSP